MEQFTKQAEAIVGPLSTSNSRTALSLDVALFPVRDVDGHQRLEQFAVVGNTQMQQFVGDDEVLESRFPVGQIYC